MNGGEIVLLLFHELVTKCDTHLQNQLSLTFTQINSTPRRGAGDALWATSNQKEVFTGKAVRLLFEIAARPILFIINSLQVVYKH